MNQDQPAELSHNLGASTVRLRIISAYGADAQERVRCIIAELEGKIVDLLSTDEPPLRTLIEVEFRPRSVLSAGEIVSRLIEFGDVSFLPPAAAPPQVLQKTPTRGNFT